MSDKNNKQMNILQLFVIIWISGWLLSSGIYVLYSVINAKKTGMEWSFKKQSQNIAAMLIVWPFTVMIYLYARVKSKR